MENYENERRFQAAWESVEIVREVKYSLFTFGESDLPYFLVLEGTSDDQAVSITKGNVKVTRPRIITPDQFPPEFEDFFESSDDENLARFIMARTASFQNLKLRNQAGQKRLVTDSVGEAIAQLSKQLDDEEEDHVAILKAPAALAGFAVLKYASERIANSARDNIQELRERGFLP